MARLRSSHSADRQSAVHFSIPKMADPFVIAKANAITSPHDRVTEAPTIFRAPQGMLSELVHHERAKTRLSSKRTPARDVLAPKHAGVTKSGRRTPFSARSDRNTKLPAKSIASLSGKHTGKRRQRRISTTRPDHPLFRQYEGTVKLGALQSRTADTYSCNCKLPKTHRCRPTCQVRQSERINRQPLLLYTESDTKSTRSGQS